jgi:hypothetical protein
VARPGPARPRSRRASCRRSVPPRPGSSGANDSSRSSVPATVTASGRRFLTAAGWRPGPLGHAWQRSCSAPALCCRFLPGARKDTYIPVCVRINYPPQPHAWFLRQCKCHVWFGASLMIFLRSLMQRRCLVWSIANDLIEIIDEERHDMSSFLTFDACSSSAYGEGSGDGSVNTVRTRTRICAAESWDL